MEIYDQFGIKRNMAHVNAVDHIFKIKQKSGSDPWPVIEAIIKLWRNTNPTQYKAHLIEVREIRETRREKKFASSDKRKDKKHGGTLRYTLDIPEKVIYMIRMIYSSKELDMNREFFIKWGKKFPETKIAERI